MSEKPMQLDNIRHDSFIGENEEEATEKNDIIDDPLSGRFGITDNLSSRRLTNGPFH